MVRDWPEAAQSSMILRPSRFGIFGRAMIALHSVDKGAATVKHQLIPIAVPFAACMLAALYPGSSLAQGTTNVYFGTFYKPVCDKLVPGFESATATNYAAWEHQNHAAVAALEANSQFQAKRREALAPPPPEIAAGKTQELVGTCERIAGLFESVAPADPRLAAPERTWESFRNALRDANRAGLVACLTGNARKSFAAQFQAMTDEQLKRTAASIAEMKLTEGDDNVQHAVIVQRDGSAGTVVFMRSGANWRIGEM